MLESFPPRPGIDHIDPVLFIEHFHERTIDEICTVLGQHFHRDLYTAYDIRQS